MKTIFIIIIVILAGLLFGFLLAKLFLKMSNCFLGRKARREILKGEDKPYFFRKLPYSLKQDIQGELNKRVKFKDKIKNLFKKKVKGGISQYGRTDDTGFKREQVFANSEGTTNATTEQPSTNPPESNGEQRSINSNLP